MKKIFLAAALLFASFASASPAQPIFEEEVEEAVILPAPSSNLSVSSITRIFPWSRYKANFGMEKISVRFPCSPTISQGPTQLTASAYDYQILYNFIGYFPPIGNVAPRPYFDRILFDMSQPPIALLSYTTYQTESGDWVLDYVAHDTFKNFIIKTRCVVTPFNAYTLQVVIPNGLRDHFEYFLESFRIHCECQQ